MKTYIGQRPADEGEAQSDSLRADAARVCSGTCQVVVVEDDGQPRPLPLIVRHANSFEWGYAGSGPATTALSILADYLGYEPDRPLALQVRVRGDGSARRLHPHGRPDRRVAGRAAGRPAARRPGDPNRLPGLDRRARPRPQPQGCGMPRPCYGCWWSLDAHRGHPRWRVSFIVDTGEVYAVEMAGQRPDHFIVLGNVPGGRAAMERAMRGWAEGELYLPDLAGRFE